MTQCILLTIRYNNGRIIACWSILMVTSDVRDVAALVRSRTNGLQPFESTIEQTTETMPLTLRQYQLLQ